MGKLDVASIAIIDQDTDEVDVDATCEALFSQVKEYADLRKNDVERIDTALMSFFEENPKFQCNSPALITLTVNKLGFTPASYGPLTKRVGEVLRQNELIMTRKGPNTNGSCRLRTEAELAYYREHGKDMVAAKTADDKVAKLEAKIAALKAKQA